MTTPNDQSTGAPGTVLAYLPTGNELGSEHERVTLMGFARRLAALKGCQAVAIHEAGKQYPEPVYFVPGMTLGSGEARALGIHGPDDLFGGVVPHAFVGTKAISHPLLSPDAAAVPGWNPAFVQQLGDAVLAGYTAFGLDDARRAGLRLLASGPVRLKPVRANAGRGQSVARDAAALQELLDRMDAGEVAAHGLVLEEDLGEMRTFSVGQVTVAGLTASYFGFQRFTRNNEGLEVFGGSELTAVRGDFDALLALAPAPEIRHAIEQARRYDAAAHACFPGLFASRRNYDILLGRDAAGRTRSAVLEQSWRVGGATGPELAALELFRADPARKQARAGSFEVFGDSPPPPPQATVHFRGTDPKVGRLTKYTLVLPDDDAG